MSKKKSPSTKDLDEPRLATSSVVSSFLLTSVWLGTQADAKLKDGIKKLKVEFQERKRKYLRRKEEEWLKNQLKKGVEDWKRILKETGNTKERITYLIVEDMRIRHNLEVTGMKQLYMMS